jgi:hypothetical protein
MRSLSGTGGHATEAGLGPRQVGYLARVPEPGDPAEEPTQLTKDILARGEELLTRARRALVQMDEALARSADAAEGTPQPPPTA